MKKCSKKQMHFSFLTKEIHISHRSPVFLYFPLSLNKLVCSIQPKRYGTNLRLLSVCLIVNLWVVGSSLTLVFKWQMLHNTFFGNGLLLEYSAMFRDTLLFMLGVLRQPNMPAENQKVLPDRATNQSSGIL